MESLENPALISPTPGLRVGCCFSHPPVDFDGVSSFFASVNNVALFSRHTSVLRQADFPSLLDHWLRFVLLNRKQDNQSRGTCKFDLVVFLDPISLTGLTVQTLHVYFIVLLLTENI